jgi:5-methylcytosine-specific restriction endonuclease McrA
VNHVFVIDAARRPLSMCHPARARALLREGKAAVLRRYPFTIILAEALPEAVVKPLSVKVDPGAKETGLSLVDEQNRVLFAAVLTHRGNAIKEALTERRQYRRNRRARNTRYRPARFNHRTCPDGWLPPSLQHRVDTTLTWVNRFRRFALVDGLALERVKFDMHLMQNPEISSVEYQQGELQGYEVREYLLEKFNRTCCYGGETNVPLEIEHVVAKANGGSNRVSNLCLACRPCNQKKGSQRIEDFLAKKPALLAKLKAQLKKPLASAAAVNATRNAILAALCATGLPVETGSGAQTKFNRIRLGYPKAHWIDAACVGDSGATVTLDPQTRPLLIKACGHGVRQRCRPDQYGFPRNPAPRAKKFAGYQTGDLVKANLPSGKFAGRHTGRIAIRHRPSFRLSTGDAVFDVHPKYLVKIHSADGYAYR